MRRLLLALLLAGCASKETRTDPPPTKPIDCSSFPSQIARVATLDRENEERKERVRRLEQTVSELQAKLAEAARAEKKDEAAEASAPPAAAPSPPPPEAQVSTSDGRVRVRLSSELVFASGRARISRPGRRALAAVAAVLAHTPGRIEVHGHTDDSPAGAAWEDNWQLSLERARRVVAFLLGEGIEGRRLVAVGHADTDPVERGGGEGARSRNRRVEIFVEPEAAPRATR